MPDPVAPRHPLARRLGFGLWLIAPALLLAVHLGPGQGWQRLDDAAERRAAGQAAAARGDWTATLDADQAALSALAAAVASPAEAARAAAPPTRAENALALDQAHARLESGDLAEALGALTDLLPRAAADPAQADLAAQVRHELATASYQAAWVMRLEGAAADEWGIEAGQAARQHFRLLAESGAEPVASAAAENLEATIRLQRMDLSELKGLPLPKNCQGCSSLSQRRRQQRESRSDKPGQGKKPGKPQDARDEIKKQSRGASLEARGEGAGS